VKLPKRFKLDRAASAKPRPETELHLDVVHVQDQPGQGMRLVVSDGDGAAVVPVLNHDERPGADLPRLEPGEGLSLGLVPLQAVREATKGTKGPGLLRIGERSTEAQAQPGKAWVRVENPEPAGRVPNFDEALDATGHQAPPTHRYVEVALDAQLLAGIAAAIGAEEGVRLRFLVDNVSGKADAANLAHGIIDVRPIRENDGGRGVLMIHVVSQ
jgi:hypothetical protein